MMANRMVGLAQDQAHGEPHHLITEPSGEVLRGERVLMLADVAFVDRPGKLQKEHDEIKREEVEQRLEILAWGDALGPIANAGGEARFQEKQQDGRENQEVPELEPVSAFEVSVGASFLVGRNGGEPGVGGGLDVEVRSGAGGGGNFEFQRRVRLGDGGKDCDCGQSDCKSKAETKCHRGSGNWIARNDSIGANLSG